MSTAHRKTDNPLYDGPSPTEEDDVNELIERQRYRDKILRAETRHYRRRNRIERIKLLTDLARHSDVWQPTKRWRLANPSPIALWGYGMTIILTALGFIGHWQYMAVSYGMAVVFGGGIQIVGGILAYVRGDTFPWSVFTLNGAFWLSLVGIFALPDKSVGGSPILSTPTEYFVGVYLLLWTIVAFAFLVASVMININVFLIFASQFLAYLFFTIGLMAHVDSMIHAGGYTAIVSGGLALIHAYNTLLSEVFDRVIIPVVYFQQLPCFRHCAKSTYHKEAERADQRLIDDRVSAKKTEPSSTPPGDRNESR